MNKYMPVHYATEQGGHSSHRRDVCTASPVGPEGFPQEIALSSPDGIHCRQETRLGVAAKEWISSAGSIIRLTGIATGGQLTRCCARTKDSPAQRKKTNCIEWKQDSLASMGSDKRRVEGTLVYPNNVIEIRSSRVFPFSAGVLILAMNGILCY